MYGLPKIHKKEALLRPIVASIGSVMYQSAKYLARVIGPLVGHSEHHIINSVDFVKKVQNFYLQQTSWYHMVLVPCLLVYPLTML